MMKRLILRPASAALACLGAAAVLSMSLVLAPSASADMPLAYQVVVDDGVGRIVSMGELDVSGAEAVSDQLGEDVRFQLAAQPCEDEAASQCHEDATRLVLSLWSYRDGQVVTATNEGIDVLDDGLTSYETRISDGRTVTVLLEPRTQN